jgi:hypothetical protein
VYGPYCAQCGQETVIGRLTLREFGHEYIQNFVSLEGRLWRTLWLLLRHPGRLTVEFLAGRRRRYVRPLPLYFSTSFVLFLLMAIFPAKLVQMNEKDGPSKNAVSVGGPGPAPGSLQTGPAGQAARPPAVRASAGSAGPDDDVVGEVPALFKPLVTRIKASADRLKTDPDYGAKRLSASVLAKLPYALFALVPMFALSTRLVYWRRRRAYAEHFLFALHLHSFVFVSLAACYALSGDTAAGLLFLVWMAYLVMALRTLFGGRRWPQVLRAMLLALMHSLVLGIVMLLVLGMAFLSV